jgi:hypothetical protein
MQYQLQFAAQCGNAHAQQLTLRVPGLCQSLPPAAAAGASESLLQPLLGVPALLLTAEGAGICTTAAAPAILAAAAAGAGISKLSAEMTADGAGDSGCALPDVRRL